MNFTIPLNEVKALGYLQFNLKKRENPSWEKKKVETKGSCKMEEDEDLCCNSLHPQDQAPDDPLHDQGSQYASLDSPYLAPFCRQVPRSPTNHHFHSLLLQFLSQDNEHLLSGKDRHTHLFESNNWLNPIFPSSFSVHPCQERPWANTDGSQGFSRLICWGYVQLLLIQGYIPGWIRFVRQDLVSVHTT